MDVSVESLRPVEVLWILNRESEADMRPENAIQAVIISMQERGIIEIDEADDIRELVSMDMEDFTRLKCTKSREDSDLEYSRLRDYEKQIVEETPHNAIKVSSMIEDFDFEDFFASKNIYRKEKEDNSVSILGKSIIGSSDYSIELIDRNWSELKRQIMNKNDKLRREYRYDGQIDDSDVAYVPVFRTISRWSVDYTRYWDVDKGYSMGE